MTESFTEFRFRCVKEFAEFFQIPFYQAEYTFEMYEVNQFLEKNYRELTSRETFMPEIIRDYIEYSRDPDYVSM